MSNTSKLVLIRHGETDWNVDRRFQGQIDVPLNEMGRQQARDVAKDLCAMQAKALRTSPLARAFETAKIIGDMCGLPPVVDEDLKEIDVGRWGGLLDPEVAEQFPEEHEAWTAGEDIARGGGETYREAGKRGADAIENIVASFEEDSLLLIVSHGIVLRESIAHLMSRRVIASASEAKHLGNAEWIEFTIIR